ncbi:MAG: globin [Planctomycetes bacterium]|jgi:hemoglobin|nr:globin [Planctomycetota bacterium]
MGIETTHGASDEGLHPHALYGRLGADAFWRIARAFYGRIERDALLRPIFPADLEEPIRNQAEFLIQYFGGPQAYSERKGHPRLRMRHAPYAIGLAERNAWVAAMEGALDDAAIPEPDRTLMQRYFAHTATFLMNSDG